jgi:hypothetical protein
LDLTKSAWTELKRLLKEYANGQELATTREGWSAFYRNMEKLVIGALEQSSQTSPVRVITQVPWAIGYGLKSLIQWASPNLK